MAFTIMDPEVLTKDQQRLGIEVAGTVHRPGLDKADIILASWANYSTFYTDDRVLVGDAQNPGGLMQRLGAAGGQGVRGRPAVQRGGGGQRP